MDDAIKKYLNQQFTVINKKFVAIDQGFAVIRAKMATKADLEQLANEIGEHIDQRVLS